MNFLDNSWVGRLGAVQGLIGAAGLLFGGLRWIGVLAVGDPLAAMLTLIGAAILLSGVRKPRAAPASRSSSEETEKSVPSPPAHGPATGPSLTDLARQEVRRHSALITRLLDLERQGRQLRGGLFVDAQQFAAWEAEVVHALRSAGRNDLVEQFNAPEPWLAAMFRVPDHGQSALDRKLDRLGVIIAGLQALPPSQPVKPDQTAHRRELADAAEQRAAALRGLCARWEGRITVAGQTTGTQDEKHQRVTEQVSDFLEAYHTEHSVQTERTLEQVIEQGVIDRPERDLAAHPTFFNDVLNLSELLRVSAHRLRIHDPALANWLGARQREVEGLRDELREQAAEVIPHYETLEMIRDRFKATNTEVMRKLGTEAKPWLSFYNQDPSWWAGGVIRISQEAISQEADYFDFAAKQIARIRDQVAR